MVGKNQNGGKKSKWRVKIKMVGKNLNGGKKSKWPTT